MSSASVKILALLVFNLAILGASMYLLTFSPTTALPIIGNIRGGLPFASFVKDGGGLNLSVIGLWTGMGIFWLAGNAAIQSVGTDK